MAEKQIPDGEPIPMSEFTLGERYGSEDMWRDIWADALYTHAKKRGGLFVGDTISAYDHTVRITHVTHDGLVSFESVLPQPREEKK